MGDKWQLTTINMTLTCDPLFCNNLTAPTNLTNSTKSNWASNTKISSYYQHSLSVAIVFTLAYMFIFLLCMVGNGLVVLIVVRNRHMRTVTNLFILNLAISDLLVGIFCVPTTLVDNLITGWPFSNAVCKLSGLVQGVSVCASVFTLVAIAVHRFRCIVYPIKPKITLFVAKATIGLVWVLALVIMLPSVVMLTVEREEGHFMVSSDNQTLPLYSCYETWPDPEMRKVYTVVLFTHIYLVPLALIMIMYGCIGAKLYSTAVLSSLEPTETGQLGRSPISHRKVKVIKMLILVAVLFMVSWLPLWTLMLITDYARPEGEKLNLLTSYIFPFSHWLAFSNSSVNPIIYGYFNENFKRGFQAACHSARCWEALPRERAERTAPLRSKTQTQRDTAQSANPLILGVRNCIYTGSDPTGCVCLEMERKREEGTVEAGGLGAEGSTGGPCLRRGLHGQDGSRVTTSGAVVCRAWEV